MRRWLASFPDAELAVTSAPDDARELATRAAARWDPVVAAGGDGTAADVAAGILAAGGGARLGILPLGTGNDLARALGIPLRLRGALALLRAPLARPLDAARVQGSERPWLLNAAVFGAMGGIARRLHASRRRRWGAAAYLRAALGELGDLRPRRLTLEVDGETHRLEAVMAVVANGPFAGGRIPLAPGARPDDGVLDVTVVPALPIPALVTEAVRLLTGRAARSRRLLRLRGRRVEVSLEPAGPANLDGETVPPAPLGFRVEPGALRVVAPGL